VREAIAVEKDGVRMEPKKTADFPVPEELTERLRRDPRFKGAFEALTPGPQGIPPPLCRGQATGYAGGVNRKRRCRDIRRQWVPGKALAIYGTLA
jgi:hypothetical protein